MTDIEVEIRELIKKEGAITFEKFMSMALYGTDLNGGYYNSDNVVWGKPSDGGDYVTNMDISNTFAVMLGKCFFEMWQSLDSPKSFTLLEAGSGRGTLTLEVIKSVAEKSSSSKEYENFLKSIIVVLVDRGEALKNSVETLNSLLEENVQVFSDITDVSESFVGVVYSNELFDAMPVNMLVNDGGLKEVYVDLDNNDELVEVVKELSDQKLDGYLENLELSLAEGSRCEVNIHMEGFVSKASELIEKGYLLTVDYGYPAKQLYDATRTEGTLLCHYKHKLNDKPLTNVGLQDITAHIDFTSLARFGKSCGMETVGFTTQSAFLLGLGVTDEFQALMSVEMPSAEQVKQNQAIKELVLPGGVGDTFKVMVQSKSAKEGSTLSCFSFKNLKDKLF